MLVFYNGTDPPNCQAKLCLTTNVDDSQRNVNSFSSANNFFLQLLTIMAAVLSAMEHLSKI